jgi:hypothetical protein
MVGHSKDVLLLIVELRVTKYLLSALIFSGKQFHIGLSWTTTIIAVYISHLLNLLSLKMLHFL